MFVVWTRDLAHPRPTAGSLDFNKSMKSRAPIVFAWVLGLAFLLLLITFRSIVIPVTASPRAANHNLFYG